MLLDPDEKYAKARVLHLFLEEQLQHFCGQQRYLDRHRSHLMRNIAVILALLLLPYWLLTLAEIPESLRGRAGISLVFAFTGVGHFIRTSAMTQMLPDWVPLRVPLIYATGVFELLAAVAILIAPLSRVVGLAICAFLLLILPSNIYAAFQRVNFGGHAAGPVYLLVRVPLQLFLVGWVYWFALR
jgi:uncharacterized membrane protein